MRNSIVKKATPRSTRAAVRTARATPAARTLRAAARATHTVPALHPPDANAAQARHAEAHRIVAAVALSSAQPLLRAAALAWLLTLKPVSAPL